MSTNHWLKDPRNVVQVWLAGPAWANAAGDEVDHGSRLAETSVSVVVAFYESHDAAGLAETLRRNAVNGADLIAFPSPEAVVEALHVPPFAARKICSLRDGFM